MSVGDKVSPCIGATGANHGAKLGQGAEYRVQNTAGVREYRIQKSEVRIQNTGVWAPDSGVIIQFIFAFSTEMQNMQNIGAWG